MTNIIRLAAAVFVFSTLGSVCSLNVLRTERDQNGRWIVLKTGEDFADMAFNDGHINVSLLAYYMEKFPEEFEAVETTSGSRTQRDCVGQVLPGLSVSSGCHFFDNREWEADKSMSTVMRNTDKVLIINEDENRRYSLKFLSKSPVRRLFSDQFSVTIDNLQRFIAKCGERIASSHEALVADHEALKSENHSLNKKCEELTIERDEFREEIERLNAEMIRMQEENERLQQSLDSSFASGHCISPEPGEPGNCPEEEEESPNC